MVYSVSCVSSFMNRYQTLFDTEVKAQRHPTLTIALASLTILLRDIPDERYRTCVLLSSTNKVPARAQDDCGSKHNDSPVEGRGVGILCTWPWGPEQAEETIHETNSINHWSESSKRKASRRERLRAESASIQHTSNRDGVCCHQSHELKRDDGRERNSGSNVDQGEDGTEDAGEDNSVAWYS